MSITAEQIINKLQESLKLDPRWFHLENPEVMLPMEDVLEQDHESLDHACAYFIFAFECHWDASPKEWEEWTLA